MSDSGDKKQSTRVFKKSSPNGKITTYLCKRDFIDSLTQCDPIEGVVLVDPDYIRERKVFTHVLAAFRYGREDLDVLGLTFRKDLYLASAQVFPCVYETDSNGDQVALNPPTIVATGTNRDTKTNTHSHGGFVYSGDRTFDGSETPKSAPCRLTRLQERLIKKLGSNAFPFFFKLPPYSPASVILQPGPNESGKPCGVDYELRTYVMDSDDDKPQKRSAAVDFSFLRRRLNRNVPQPLWDSNSVRLAIRKLTYAPEEPAPQPSAVVVKDFIMSPGSLRLEVTLDKEKYYHGESIAVNVLVDNNSNKTVKKIKLSVRQNTELCFHNKNRYSCVVDELESEESFPIYPSQTGWCKVYRLRPLLANNRHKRGLALDGKLKHEDTNLASSTIIVNPQQRENFGMIVQYRIKVRLVLGFGSSDISLELPFTLTHPKPIAESTDETFLKMQELEEVTSDSVQPEASASLIENDLIVLDEDPTPLPKPFSPNPVSNNPVNPTVPSTQLTSIVDDEDLVFEDFARLRLAANQTDPHTKAQFSGNGIF